MVYSLLSILVIVAIVCYIALLIYSAIKKTFTKTITKWMVIVCFVAAALNIAKIFFKPSGIFNAIVWSLIALMNLAAYKNKFK